MNDASRSAISRYDCRYATLGARCLRSYLEATCFSVFFFAVTTHEITHVGTQNGAYKGNLGAKVLLFFDLCKCFCKKTAKLLQKFFKKIIEFLPFLL